MRREWIDDDSSQFVNILLVNYNWIKIASLKHLREFT